MRVLILLMTGFLMGPFLQGEIMVITSVSNRTDTISKEEVKAIFLGEKVSWKDGSRIKIADNLDKSAAREFYTLYVGKESSRIKRIWIKKMLRGKMSPPESFKNQEELVDFVANRKQSIGFISGGEVPAGVKALKVIEKK